VNKIIGEVEHRSVCYTNSTRGIDDHNWEWKKVFRSKTLSLKRFGRRYSCDVSILISTSHDVQNDVGKVL
jgi:hypothetical protein